MGGRVPIELFGPYAVFERLGVGGMATVHRAVKTGIAGFERVVALKRLLPHQAENEELIRAFVREAKLASLLQHDNIAATFELGRVGEQYFIAMEYIEGHDVRRVLQRAAREEMRIPVGVALSIVYQLCDALDYAHTRCHDDTGEPLGIVHRDVSPSNLILTHAGQLKIIDFGVAKAMPRELRTHSGKVKGKFGYMSPEAQAGEALDARSDVFSAGVVAHELLTVRRLFGSKYDYETLERMRRVAVAPPSERNPDCPPELDDVVMTALERDPDDRWSSAAALRDALHAVARDRELIWTSEQIAEWLDYALGDPPQVVIELPGVDDGEPGEIVEVDGFLEIDADEITELAAWSVPTVQELLEADLEFDTTTTVRE